MDIYTKLTYPKKFANYYTRVRLECIRVQAQQLEHKLKKYLYINIFILTLCIIFEYSDYFTIFSNEFNKLLIMLYKAIKCIILHFMYYCVLKLCLVQPNSYIHELVVILNSEVEYKLNKSIEQIERIDNIETIKTQIKK